MTQINILLVMGDTPLSAGITSVLSRKKNVHINRLCPDHAALGYEIEKSNAGVVVLDAESCTSHPPEFLLNLISHPNITEVLIVSSDNNLVHLFKKQQVVVNEQEDFTRLFLNNFQPTKGEVQL